MSKQCFTGAHTVDSHSIQELTQVSPVHSTNSYTPTVHITHVIRIDLLLLGMSDTMPELGQCSYPLIDLPNDYTQSVQELIWHIKNIIADNEKHHDRRCVKFYIGKSYVHTWKGRVFDPHKPDTTWNKTGINGRWRARRNLGYHVMVVLTTITKESLCHLNHHGRAEWKEQYALALEQALINHFLFEEDDPRLANPTTNPGRYEGGRAIAYVLYLAMKFESPSQTAISITDSPKATGSAGALSPTQTQSIPPSTWLIQQRAVSPEHLLNPCYSTDQLQGIYKSLACEPRTNPEQTRVKRSANACNL